MSFALTHSSSPVTGGSREPLDPPYFYGSRTSLSKLSVPVLVALRARCGGGAPQHDPDRYC